MNVVVVDFVVDENRKGTSPFDIVVIVETKLVLHHLLLLLMTTLELVLHPLMLLMNLLNVEETIIGISPFDAVFGFVVDKNIDVS